MSDFCVCQNTFKFPNFCIFLLNVFSQKMLITKYTCDEILRNAYILVLMNLIVVINAF